MKAENGKFFHFLKIDEREIEENYRKVNSVVFPDQRRCNKISLFCFASRKICTTKA
jgi:hypothetical protein